MSRLPEAIAGIDVVKRRLMGMRGFKGAYWMNPINGSGMSVILFEDEASAREGAFPAGFSPAPGVTIEGIETREVIGQA